MEFRRINIRLPATSYIGRQWYFLTACTQDRVPRPDVSLSAVSWFPKRTMGNRGRGNRDQGETVTLARVCFSDKLRLVV
jgi:hypothetical protein